MGEIFGFCMLPEDTLLSTSPTARLVFPSHIRVMVSPEPPDPPQPPLPPDPPPSFQLVTSTSASQIQFTHTRTSYPRKSTTTTASVSTL
ncbi:hypothetical protein EUTSA_v10000401mg [Eutrema salsugineum]|uniref:Uncharacterized protein n=1 Tax=Eutrema salsugineum TaxID=72664 RepID=V4L6V9_EUTSA|nr:hypothetical protein EUTSA_v10000401mg [Eutrema salsugineum]